MGVEHVYEQRLSAGSGTPASLKQLEGQHGGPFDAEGHPPFHQFILFQLQPRRRCILEVTPWT